MDSPLVTTGESVHPLTPSLYTSITYLGGVSEQGRFTVGTCHYQTTTSLSMVGLLGPQGEGEKSGA